MLSTAFLVSMLILSTGTASCDFIRQCKRSFFLIQKITFMAFKFDWVVSRVVGVFSNKDHSFSFSFQ